MASSVPSFFTFGGCSADCISFLGSTLLVAGYYARFHFRSRKTPGYSNLAIIAQARRLWTRGVMTETGKDVMAVQTLRNFIMVGIMMASTASLLIMGTLTLSGQEENIIRGWHSLGAFASHAQEVRTIKVLCLLIDLLVAFFSYALSLRLATQVLFMINVPPALAAGHSELSWERVADRLVQAGNLVALGMRAFMLAIPIVFWLFGPIFLFLATIGLVVTLDNLDRNKLPHRSHFPDTGP
ncbi:MAG: DUF599 domain-containing protein [Magnetococcales bacterium]|nr:DUF599 domain-containing protein [Magnetococcales bacterium]